MSTWGRSQFQHRITSQQSLFSPEAVHVFPPEFPIFPVVRRRSSPSMGDCCLGPSLCNKKPLHLHTHLASPSPSSSSSKSLSVSMASLSSHSNSVPEPNPTQPSLLVFSGLPLSWPSVVRALSRFMLDWGLCFCCFCCCCCCCCCRWHCVQRRG